jgi:uncharacterized protein YfaS (alpha-2-macroglobulin family)
MRSSHYSNGNNRRPSALIVLFYLLILTSLVGSLTGCSKTTPETSTVTPSPQPAQPTPTATKVPQTLPPALVETNPLPGAQIALKNPITFYFNQPMYRSSLEAAMTGEPALSGSFNWINDSTVTFTPDNVLSPGASQIINIAASAQSSKGMQLQQPIRLSYDTSTYLKLLQSLPADSSNDVDPTSAVVASFNQPVVPLGADPSSLPAGFTLTPSADGRGEWINTSTYIFYPEPALAGGTNYAVSVNTDLTSISGAPQESEESWAFDTILPRLVSTQPEADISFVRLDTRVQLDFSYSMDATSVQANFSLLDTDGNAVSGQSGWNEAFTTFIYTPTNLLLRNGTYTILLGSQAAALGGTTLGQEINQKFYTVPDFSIQASTPSDGGVKQNYDSVVVYLTAPTNASKVLDYVTFTPEVPDLSAWQDFPDYKVYFYGTFDPNTSYTMQVSSELADQWGEQLGQPFTLRFRTAQLDPSVQLMNFTDATFVSVQDESVPAQVTNISALPITLGTLTLNDLSQMQGDNGYDYRNNFIPADATSWTFNTHVPDNQATVVNLPLTPDGNPLVPGLYFMRLNIPDLYGYTSSAIIALSHYQLTLKLSPTEAFVWAVDLNTNTAAAGLPVTVYNQLGSSITSGITDANGSFLGAISEYRDDYDQSFVVLGTPGEDDFGFAFAYWNSGVSPMYFNINAVHYPQQSIAYIYTDRPIYRPGDTVNFRLIVRKLNEGRYSLPDLASYPLELYGPMGNKVATFDVPLSGFGTGHGEYTLPAGTLPGDYGLGNQDDNANASFQVADYRKPEINLQVAFQSTDVLSGTELVAEINARYFFDAPAGSLPVRWSLYRQTSYFNIPSYQVGVVDTSWLNPYDYNFPPGSLGEFVDEGVVQTDANGLAKLSLTPPANPGREEYVLEVTLTDESGQPVSNRSSAFVNPANYYIGVQPDAWSYEAKSPAGFSVLVTDWENNPAGAQQLTAQFRGVKWVRQDPTGLYASYGLPTYTAEYTPVATSTLTTAADGTGRISFTPPQAGTYQLDVSGDGATTQVLLWVGGAGQAVWPSLPNQRLRLVADKDSYKTGDTAQIFIPNPFSSPTLGLLTEERGSVWRSQVLHLEPGGSTIPLLLGSEEAPNVYVAVTLLGTNDQGLPDFFQGYVNLEVDPSFEYLNVALTSDPERAGPGDQVTFSLRVTDASGSPVMGEFSLAVVDKAVLSLADSTTKDIFSAFYGNQPLNVRTGNSLAALAQRIVYQPGGRGGGGGGLEAVSVTRENFPDTALWNAQIVTDENGEATVSLSLPDSLTTWQVLVRGLTQATLVGETTLDLVTTKDLLIRPVTPRFLVAGDHAQLSAVVQNNTPNPLDGAAVLESSGFVLDDPTSRTQSFSVPANGRVRLDWWGTAEDVASASLRFSVQAGSLQDAILVSRGALPVLHYTAPQTFATSGSMPDAGQRLELVNLPATFDATSGSLNVELDPSLSAAMLDTLEVLKVYPSNCTEPVLSSFLPNLVTYSTLQTFGVESTELKANLDSNLNQALDQLLALQNEDGGWGWCLEGQSDAYITSYVLFGLTATQQADIQVSENVISNTIGYVSSSLITPDSTTEAWMLDRLAFEDFALNQAGAGDPTSVDQLYQVRDQLSPWAKAMLTLSLDLLSSTSDSVPTLVSDLQSTAIRSATGVHWEAANPDWHNMTSTLSNSAIVLYTLAQLEPSSNLIPDAVNYLMSNRQADGCWSSSYEDSWILLAMDEVMKSSNELDSSYGFSASLNDTKLASGKAGGDTQLNSVVTSVPISSLYPGDPNALVIQRDPGTGRLYYTASLNVYRPVADVSPLNLGISVSRSYYIQGVDIKTAAPVTSSKVGDALTVRLTVILPTDAYHFVVEDYIPAGAEILNTNLKTTQLGDNGEPGLMYDARDPYSTGWGWWLFDPAQIYDDHIRWTAAYLPAGTYDLTYTITILQAGEYNLLPAHAWLSYFPEVQGTTAGGLMEIKP